MKEEQKKPVRHDAAASGGDDNKKDEVAYLKKELESAKTKCEEYLNGWKRERADFLNYKKEEMERIGHLVKYANEEIILKLLPVLDNMCLAAEHVEDEGVMQIKKQLEDFLAKEGIEAIEVAGKQFDPNIMEVVEVAAIDETKEKWETKETMATGVVVEEVQRGYTLHGKLIRPTKVKVSK